MKFIKKLPLLLLVFTAACFPSIIREEPAPAAEEANLITNTDINYAYSFAEDIFTSDQWERTLTSQSDRVMVTWIKSNSGNLAYLDYRIYPEGYTQEIVDWYHSDENFETILYSGYDDLSRIAECKKGSLQLYEFSANYKETPYLIYNWVDTSEKYRMADIAIIFTAEEKAELERYAKEVFPSLPSCK